MSASEENRIACAEVLDISAVQDLHQQLARVLASGGGVVLDASLVERADTAALQLLCAFMQEASVNGVSVHWHEPTAELCDAVSLLGLEAELGLSKQ